MSPTYDGACTPSIVPTVCTVATNISSASPTAEVGYSDLFFLLIVRLRHENERAVLDGEVFFVGGAVAVYVDFDFELIFFAGLVFFGQVVAERVLAAEQGVYRV